MRPVLWAAWFGHLEAMKFLINSGATPRCSNKVLRVPKEAKRFGIAY